MAVRGTVDSGAGGTLVTSVTGTANQVTTTPTAGAVVVSTPVAFVAPGTIAATSTVSGTQLISTVATGTAPLTVASTTTVANLTAAAVAVGGVTGLGTGVGAALAVNVGTAGAPLLQYTPLTNSLSGNVLLNNTGQFFDGPSVAQGSTGTWFASGTISVSSTTVLDAIYAKLWDGTTVIADSGTDIAVANGVSSISLSGFISSPAGNIRISANDPNTTNGKILANAIGSGAKDSTITVFRIA